MKKNLVGIIAATTIATGCASIHPKTPEGQMTQYATAANKVGEMQNKEKLIDENPFRYTIEDMTNAYASGCFNNTLSNNQMITLNAKQHNPEQFAPAFVEAIRGTPEERLDNSMLCYASKQVIDEAEQWKYRSTITEPLSAALWAYAFSQGGSSSNNGGGSQETIGGGSQDMGGGSSINP